MDRQIKLPIQVLVLASCLTGCASLPQSLIESPSVSLNDVQVVGLGFNNQTFLLSFDVANPNAFPIPVQTVAYGVRLDGQRFASGETGSEFTIPASGTTDFTISVDLDLLQTAPQLLSIVRGGSKRDIRYELDGRLGVDVPMVPTLNFRNSGKIQLD